MRRHVSASRSKIAALAIFPHFIFALQTGLRKSEQFGLTWSDIDFHRRVVIVPHPKNDRSREVTMSDTCFKLLQGLYRGGPDDGAVFRSDRYKVKPIIDVKKSFNGAGIVYVTRSSLD